MTIPVTNSADSTLRVVNDGSNVATYRLLDSDELMTPIPGSEGSSQCNNGLIAREGLGTPLIQQEATDLDMNAHDLVTLHLCLTVGMTLTATLLTMVGAFCGGFGIHFYPGDQGRAKSIGQAMLIQAVGTFLLFAGLATTQLLTYNKLCFCLGVCSATLALAAALALVLPFGAQLLPGLIGYSVLSQFMDLGVSFSKSGLANAVGVFPTLLVLTTIRCVFAGCFPADSLNNRYTTPPSRLFSNNAARSVLFGFAADVSGEQLVNDYQSIMQGSDSENVRRVNSEVAEPGDTDIEAGQAVGHTNRFSM